MEPRQFAACAGTLLLCESFAASPLALAQQCGPPTSYTWVRQVNGQIKQYVASEAIAVDSSGNAYVAGHTDGALPGHSHKGLIDGFLLKYSAAGVLQWTRQFGTSQDDFAVDVAVDSQSNVYVIVSTAGAFSGQSSSGQSDAVLLKYNTSGSLQWTRQFGTSGAEEVTGVALDASSNPYVVGSTNGTFGGQQNFGDFDAFIVKYNSSGSQQWRRQFGTSTFDHATAVAVDASAMAYLCGYTLGTFSGQTSHGSIDGFAARYNSSGTQQWVRQFGTASIDLGQGIAAEASAAVYIAGETLGTFGGQTSAGALDGYFIKYSAAGTQQWVRQFGTAGSEQVGGIVVDTAGHIAIAGATDGTFPQNANSGLNDAYIVKFNATGPSLLWSRQFGTSASDQINDVALDANRNLRLAGFTYGTFPGQPANADSASLTMAVPPCGKTGDVNGDGIVNINDLLALINGWGACPPEPQSCPADVSPPPNGDDVVNINDLLLIINNWG